MNTKNNPYRIQLTRCEAEVMDVIWREQRVTVQNVVDAIERDLAYTTVMTTIRILEEKGVIQRGEKIGRAFTYVPLVTRDSVQQDMAQELAEQLFGGSLQSLVLSLVKSDAVTPEDIAALRRAIAELEEGEQ